MPSKLNMFVARICESSWLAALVVVPILFNPYTERFFEEDKIPLMRSTALSLESTPVMRVQLKEGVAASP